MNKTTDKTTQGSGIDPKSTESVAVRTVPTPSRQRERGIEVPALVKGNVHDQESDEIKPWYNRSETGQINDHGTQKAATCGYHTFHHVLRRKGEVYEYQSFCREAAKKTPGVEKRGWMHTDVLQAMIEKEGYGMHLVQKEQQEEVPQKEIEMLDCEGYVIITRSHYTSIVFEEEEWWYCDSQFPQPYKIKNPIRVDKIIAEGGQIYAVCKDRETGGKGAPSAIEVEDGETEKKDQTQENNNGDAGKASDKDRETRSETEKDKARSRTPKQRREGRDRETDDGKVKAGENTEEHQAKHKQNEEEGEEKQGDGKGGKNGRRTSRQREQRSDLVKRKNEAPVNEETDKSSNEEMRRGEGKGNGSKGRITRSRTPP